MRRNIELKARCANLAAAESIAKSLGAHLHTIERQHDTYFTAADGRLKLRQRRTAQRELMSELIWYRRTDERRARASDYSLVTTDSGAALRALLGGALGIAVEVVKQRAVYLHDGVRIHLDQVEGLGHFIEFEAVVHGGCDDQAAHAKLDRLRVAFGVEPEDILRGSYADLRRELRT
jgi:adenylate cyclase, class 2